jgi:hypothetical protein
MQFAQRRRRSELTESVSKLLDMYVLAATGAGTLVLSQIADAKVVYTPANVVISTGGGLHHYNLDLNHDGIADFRFVASYSHTSASKWAILYFSGIGKNQVLGSGARNSFDAALSAGAKIGPGAPFSVDAHSMAFVISTHRSYGPFYAGPWANGGQGVNGRYLGVRFVIRGKTHYGWARVNVAVSGAKKDEKAGVSATLTGYAYETVPDKTIIAGKTKGPDDESAGELRTLALGRK